MSPGAVMDAPSPVEARFADLCKNTELGLDDSMAQQAMILFKDTHILSSNIRAMGAGSPEEMERLWSAFVLYCVVRLSPPRDNKEDTTLLLPRILKASKLKFVDFIKETPQFSLKAGFILTAFYGSDWEKKLELKEHQASIEQLSLLKRHYRRSYHEFFLPSETSSSQQSGVSDHAEFTSDYHRFGWLLFMALRVHDFGPFKDLVTCTNGLVSIMAILILHVPIRLRSFSIQESSPFAKKSDKGINLLASLSDICHTSEDELRITMEKVNKLMIDVLMKKPCPASECNRETLECIDPDGLTYFEDLLEDNSLKSCLSILEKDYDDAISTRGDLDEHVFANGYNRLLGTDTVNISGTKRKLDVFSSPTNTRTSPLSPPCSPTPSRNGILVGNCRVPAATPVTTAMTTAKWLRTVISPLPSAPSAELERFLSSCDKDLTGDVTRRANIILEAIFPSSSFGEKGISVCESMSQTDNTWAERRRMEALKLYYRILEAICRAESSIPPGNNLSLLLSSERFHRCMLACSAELVLATYKTITMAFPAVLEKTGITAFDLSKMIECFVRHEETLPRELKRHLNFLEERLLESMVWEKGSSMYNSLIVARAALSDEINRLGLLAEPLPSLDMIAMQHNIRIGCLPPLPFHKSDTSPDQNGDARSPKRICGEYKTDLLERNSFMSPIKERLLTNSLKSMMPPLQSAFASPNRRNPAGDDTCGAAGINGFFSKILKLVAIRIRSLCDRLQLSQSIQERIYFLVQKILSHQTALFFNRHIDQIILCSFYGVAKISQLSLTFKDIIYNYRKQPQCKPQVFRSVFVNWPPTSRSGKTGEEHIDIISFYNEIFIPCAKPLLVELGPSGITDNRDQEDKQNANGSVPVSPRFSPFPNLPDMSPKKVSAARNVYVSPLRSSKMDSMLSPSSKSFYACIGESTHAFQSPSKDLSAINNRLNCGRKISGRLNFDMVSDSVVAGSFGPSQSGSLVSSTANFNNPPMKCEQPDS